MNRSINPPCVIFAFNRPAFLKRVLGSLKDQGVKNLFIFVDAPRHASEQIKVEACHSIAKNIGWADTKTTFHDQHKGFVGIIENIREVFRDYEEAIFLEDDCFPMPGFFGFMREALARYGPYENVFSIGGYQPVSKTFFKNHPYSLVVSPRFMCWGWATWKHQWRQMDSILPDFPTMFDGLKGLGNIAGSDLPPMACACATGKAFSWAVPVSVAMLWLEKFQLLPIAGLVKNIGMGTGTHRKKGVASIWWRRWLQRRNLYTGKMQNPSWPNRIGLDDDYADRYRSFVDTINLPLRQQLRQFLREEWKY